MSCFGRLFGERKALPVKIQDVNRERRIGFVAKSLGELKKKACLKFEIPVKTCRIVTEGDATEVVDDDFFHQLAPHAVLVILDSGQKWTGKLDLLENALSQLLDVNQMRSLTSQIKQLILNEADVGKRHLLGTLVTSVNMNVEAETRGEDPAWFEGVAPKYKTKDSFMREKARARVRGYLYHTKDYIKGEEHNKKSTVKSKKALNSALSSFTTELKNRDYYAEHFSRSTDKAELRICDKHGWFQCEGKFDVERCTYFDHYINPYGNREFRVLFSTWDLDHGIEKSREVLPQLIHASQSIPKFSRLNWLYFFNLLFTRTNLKLVHPVCHDKSGHITSKCDQKQFYLKS